jgi:ketosteroid isomerase-like protein
MYRRSGEKVHNSRGMLLPSSAFYFEWDKASSQNDVNALLDLYAPDAVLESPQVPHLLGTRKGFCRGREELRLFFEAVAARKTHERQHHRAGYLTDGKRLIWESPRAAPGLEQMDSVQAMDIDDHGLIEHHRVYWGWYGISLFERNEHRR